MLYTELIWVLLKKNTEKEGEIKILKKAILATVKVAGLLTVAAIAPNSIKYLKSLGIVSGKRQKEIMFASKDRLVKNGLLQYKNGFLELTKNGETELELLEMKGWKMDKPKRWDGRWRMLIFDIPETRRPARDKVRQTLSTIGFYILQDSVWIYPYDCEDLVTLLKTDFRVGKDLLYLIVDSIENDKNLRKSFGLV